MNGVVHQLAQSLWPGRAASAGAAVGPTAAERAELAALAARRAGRAAAARALRSPALRWWLTPAYADELLIVPQDLRTLDPSFLSEIAADQFGLAGTLVSLGGFSPFALPPPHGAWARELHGFGWLRHLRAANHDDAQVAARAFATSWLMLERRHADIAFEPTVVARRIISWISHADLLLEGSDQKDYLAMAGSLGVDIQLLAATWRNAQDGYPRLLTLAAQVLAGLCVARLERRLARAQTLLVAEIERQILADGGHVTRNPGVLVDILLDFLPLRQCYAAREATPPPEFQAAISRMIAFVKSMRLGDGTLARFNGVSCTEADALATALSYEETDNPPLAAMPDFGLLPSRVRQDRSNRRRGHAAAAGACWRCARGLPVVRDERRGACCAHQRRRTEHCARNSTLARTRYCQPQYTLPEHHLVLAPGARRRSRARTRGRSTPIAQRCRYICR